MPRPPVKKTQKLAKAAELGRLRAEREFNKNKPLIVTVREHIEKLIDRIDALELVAVAGSTILVHATILQSEALIKQVALTKGSLLDQIGGILLNPVTLAGLIQWAMGQTAGTAQDIITKFGLDKDWEIWLISFAIAYILVHNAGAILGALSNSVTSMTGIIKLFLPAVTA